ncbi:hypothetical protein EV401DRAFT_2001621, partial [Pisolithus croceorrhizus]
RAWVSLLLLNLCKPGQLSLPNRQCSCGSCKRVLAIGYHLIDELRGRCLLSESPIRDINDRSGPNRAIGGMHG